MKRRKAIGSILLAGTATTIGFSGYEWYFLTKTPDKNYIVSRKALLTELAETIIPATETPGATDAGVIDFLMPILNECTDKKTLNRFVEGLQDLESYTHSKYSKEYGQCTQEEKETILHYFEKKSFSSFALYDKIKNKFTGSSFFTTLKSYTVYCYCISEKGATIGMRYIAVPGKNLPCIPLEPNQKGWATK